MQDVIYSSSYYKEEEMLVFTIYEWIDTHMTGPLLDWIERFKDKWL